MSSEEYGTHTRGEWDLLRLRGMTSQVALVVKSPPAKAGDLRDADSIPGSGRSPGGRHGNPFHYSCLRHPVDRGAWWATVYSSESVSHSVSVRLSVTPRTVAHQALLSMGFSRQEYWSGLPFPSPSP